MVRNSNWRRWVVMGLVAMAPVLLGGCFLILADRLMPHMVDARYKGMQNQSVAVMVWTDRGVHMDYPSLRLDVATRIQSDLEKAGKDAGELKGVKWPWEARSIVRYQNEHPEIEAMTMAEVAPRLPKLTRLIYLEVSNFSTRQEDAPQLLRGTIIATVQVVEIADGQAKVAYQEANVQAVFPEKEADQLASPREDIIYQRTLAAFSDRVAKLFYQYEVDE